MRVSPFGGLHPSSRASAPRTGVRPGASRRWFAPHAPPRAPISRVRTAGVERSPPAAMSGLAANRHLNSSSAESPSYSRTLVLSSVRVPRQPDEHAGQHRKDVRLQEGDEDL